MKKNGERMNCLIPKIFEPSDIKITTAATIDGAWKFCLGALGQGVWRTEVPSRVQGRSPGGVWGRSPRSSIIMSNLFL